METKKMETKNTNETNQLNEWETEDGWNTDYFEGFLNTADEIAELAYKIKNCQRTGDLADMINDLQRLAEELEQTADDYEYDLDEIENGSEDEEDE